MGLGLRNSQRIRCLLTNLADLSSSPESPQGGRRRETSEVAMHHGVHTCTSRVSLK